MLRQLATGASLVMFLGQVSAQDAVPAAKLGRVRDAEHGTVSRAQSGMPPMIPPGGTPLVPAPGNPMNGTTPLPPAQPLPKPMVIAEPGVNPVINQPMAPPTQSYPIMGVPPAATMTMPMMQQPNGMPHGAIPIGQPYMVSPPSVQPYGSTMMGESYTTAPGMPAPQMDQPLYTGIGGPTALLLAPSRWRVSAEYLLWWTKSQQVPALVTTSSPQFNGILGSGDTRIIFGDNTLGNTLHGGGRFSATRWFDDTQTWGLDASLFFLGRNGSEFRTSTFENPLLARPFTNLNQNIPFSEVVGAPGLAVGAISVVNNTQVWGADFNFRRALICAPCYKLDLLFGYKYFRLTDDITITESFQRLGSTNVGLSNAISGTVTDRFETQNDFHGVNLGLAGELHRGRWTVEGRMSVALGTVFQNLNVAGSQNILTTNGLTRSEGGLLALPGANIGQYQQNQFAAVPEAGFKIGYNLTNNLRVGVGYNFMYLSDALRAGNQIDTGLDVTRIPNFPVPGNPSPLIGATRPSPILRTTDFFVQGVSFSVQYNW